MWNVSPRTHCRLLRYLLESSGVRYDLMSRSFYDSISRSNNEYTRFCSLLCKSSRSAIAENRRMLLSNFNKSELCEIETPMLQKYFSVMKSVKTKGDMLKELCLIRDKRLLLISMLERSSY